MKITGHKTRSVFERYNITSEDDLKLAAAKLNQRDEAARHQAEGYVSGYVRPKPAAVAKLSRLN